MDNPDIEKMLKESIAETQRWAQNDLPRIAGKIAVEHFKENFLAEGFVNNGVHKWKEVKRREPSSPWYGFDYKGEKRSGHPIRRGKKGQKLKNQRRLNYSTLATQRKILTGKTMELQDSLTFHPVPGGVIISSDKPYASVQNFGGVIKIFGKKSVQLSARPFVGNSKELEEKIDNTINGKINEILNK